MFPFDKLFIVFCAGDGVDIYLIMNAYPLHRKQTPVNLCLVEYQVRMLISGE